MTCCFFIRTHWLQVYNQNSSVKSKIHCIQPLWVIFRPQSKLMLIHMSLIEKAVPDSKVHGGNMGPTWVLSAPDGPMLVPWTLLSGVVNNSVFRDDMAIVFTNFCNGTLRSLISFCCFRITNDFIKIKLINHIAHSWDELWYDETYAIFLSCPAACNFESYQTIL